MESHNPNEKTFALLDTNNKVVNVVCVLGDDEPLLALLAEHWGAITWKDTQVYGDTEIGGFFDGEKLNRIEVIIEDEDVAPNTDDES
jgi:hypothetical protein